MRKRAKSNVKNNDFFVQFIVLNKVYKLDKINKKLIRKEDEKWKLVIKKLENIIYLKWYFQMQN
jgi:hypothetical protein